MRRGLARFIGPAVALLMSASTPACGGAGGDSLDELLHHTEAVVRILEEQRGDPVHAMEQVEAYERQHAETLRALADEAATLRLHLSSASKRALLADLQERGAALEARLAALNAPSATN